MKMTIIAVAGAALLGAASFAVPASALPLHGITTSNPSLAQTVRFQHRQVCTVKKVVKRGPYGRRVVKKVRVCR